MSDLRLSVVICTYNGVSYLQEQLDSLLAQGRLPDEIIVGDDGSTDGSWDLLQAFTGRARDLGVDARLTQHPVNLGYVKNFESMLRQATGDVLLLCDQDDVWRKDKLEVVGRRFEQEPSMVLLHSDARLIDAKGGSLRHGLFESLELSPYERSTVRSGGAFGVLLRRNIVTGATAAVRRDVIDAALPIGNGWIHDEWLGIVAAAIGRVDFINDSLIDYRQHGANQIGISRRTWKMRLDDMLLPRTALIDDKVLRLRTLLDRLRGIKPSLHCPDAKIESVEDAMAHFLARQKIEGARGTRVLPIFRELLKGRYRRYGTGVRGALRDFLRRG